MKALTLWPEWLWAVTHLGKPLENRTYPPPESLIGERIALHAGLKVGGVTDKWGPRFLEAVGLVMEMAGEAGWGPMIIKKAQLVEFHMYPVRMGLCLENLPRGVVVATALVAGYHHDYKRRPWGAKGQYQWKLEDVRKLGTPIPCRGYQRLWNLPPEVERAVREQGAA